MNSTLYATQPNIVLMLYVMCIISALFMKLKLVYTSISTNESDWNKILNEKLVLLFKFYLILVIKWFCNNYNKTVTYFPFLNL